MATKKTVPNVTGTGQVVTNYGRFQVGDKIVQTGFLKSTSGMLKEIGDKTATEVVADIKGKI
jgi:hypothetical protein